MQFKTYPLPGGGELDVYLRTPAPAMPNALRRPLVLVVPGGGYEHVSAREADPVALQFAAAGYHAAVLTYSVGEGARNYQPLRQLSAALALLREHAEAWGVLPEQIAVCGFSAGGHLALSGAVLDLPGGEAAAQCGAAGLPGGHGRRARPPGQLCSAVRQRGPGGPPEIHAGR